jgi:hypothetical protein
MAFVPRQRGWPQAPCPHGRQPGSTRYTATVSLCGAMAERWLPRRVDESYRPKCAAQLSGRARLVTDTAKRPGLGSLRAAPTRGATATTSEKALAVVGHCGGRSGGLSGQHPALSRCGCACPRSPPTQVTDSSNGEHWSPGAGPRWVRTASEAAGPRRAQAVITGVPQSEVTGHPRPRTTVVRGAGRRVRTSQRAGY